MKTHSVIRRIISVLLVLVLAICLLTAPVMAEELIDSNIEPDINTENKTEELTGPDEAEHLEDKLSGEDDLLEEQSDKEVLTEELPGKENLTEELSDKGTPTENLLGECRSSSILDEKQKEEQLQIEPVSLPIELEIASSEINEISLQNFPLLGDIDPDTEADGYKLRWDDTDAIITVSINRDTAESGAAIKAGDEVTLHVTLGADRAIIKCEYSCTFNAGTEAEPSYVPQTFSLLSQPSNPDFSFTVPTITTDVIINVVLSQSYPVWVAGTQVTDANKGNVLIGETNSVVFVPETRTLNLTDAAIKGVIEFYYDEPVTLLIAGDNTVEGASTEEEAGNANGFGIVSQSDLRIKPFGDFPTLTVFTPNEVKNACAICVEDADLLIEETTSVEVFTGDAEETSIGIQANNITVAGQLDAYAGEASFSCGIICEALLVKNGVSASGGTVLASGADCPEGSSTGTAANALVEVESNASLVADGGAASGMSRGLNVSGKVNVFGELQCNSSTGIEGSTAIQCTEISTSGMLTAKSASSAEGQCIAVLVGSFEATAGSVSAVAGTGSASSELGSIAITADSISISGGSILAESAGKALSGKPSFTNGYIPVVRISDSSITEVRRTEAVDTPATYFHKYLQITSSVITVTPETTTVPEGRNIMLAAHVEEGYIVHWTSGNDSIVTVNAATGEITGVAPGKTRVIASAYLSDGTTLVESAFCEVTVTAADIPLESIILLPERISLCSGNTSTLQYILYPSNTTDKNITWSAAGDTDSISYTVNPEAGTVIITGVKAGSVALTAASASGKRAYCSITVSDYVITYLDNSGMWYYDKSDGFTLSASGPLSDFTGVLIDGVSVPRFSGNQQNWAAGEQNGHTVLTFSKQYMASLPHGKHTVRLAFTAMTTPEKNIYIQLSTDPPITGDAPVAPFVLAFLLSGFGFAAACSVKKREK